ncbi:Electron transfer flavoprotein alpha subunit [Alicyclobacillus hesperidum URH17-3-68]|uniref:Electron transfer flavoprotein alpha subunit apoprotein n=1 Tax=Alicyclobacillus hesperidum TaxID=89784 RepID=A0A1H2SSH6_9BACL|nr:electron transfer flavoprotein subunit alpha/FixB family protein [Alicyclobacillus hesperidum]EJY55124.1 Electron transfer flavoprotein alpha subunit [Alicyclobacillus hesperidum URH17-3-68]GLV12506.1 electron transfer flavoprotein subunit alpha [Alicyclobacillus hesperidum]SDW33999.1 electron transfer flavoprotein alpha subunit apoprotein [Alicyclobacillus hesperidum]
MGKTVLVIAEQKDQKLRQVSLEALAAARQLAGDGGNIVSVLVGDNVDAAAQQLADHEQSQVVCVTADILVSYEAEHYFAAVQPVIDEVKPDIVILPHTASGRDLAPKIACHLDAGQISDVVAIEAVGEDVTFKRPIYAGKAFETKRFLTGPWVVTIRPNNLQADATNGAAAPIVKRTYTEPTPVRSQVVDVQRKSGDTRDLTEAKVVVSGGRGVRSADGFAPLAELAEVLDGALGASRAACDAGYCDYSLQIGQTGKVVTPDVYIACGISGAIQHLAGMSQSKLIIAINKDGEAPIFDIADYGVVGDLFEIVPKLTEKLRDKIAAVRS